MMLEALVLLLISADEEKPKEGERQDGPWRLRSVEEVRERRRRRRLYKFLMLEDMESGGGGGGELASEPLISAGYGFRPVCLLSCSLRTTMRQKSSFCRWQLSSRWRTRAVRVGWLRTSS